MDRLICNSLGAIIFPRLTKFKEKDILSECFKFSDLNLGLTEAMEIPKATAQRLRKLDIAAFLHYYNVDYWLYLVWALITKLGSF